MTTTFAILMYRLALGSTPLTKPFFQVFLLTVLRIFFYVRPANWMREFCLCSVPKEVD